MGYNICSTEGGPPPLPPYLITLSPLPTYEEDRGKSASDVDVTRSPGEGCPKLPGDEEAHDSHPSVQADVADGSKND